ncbi:MAG: DUF4185 domain-containing protein, partial [Nocardioidaceae bacterium]|nr:DUF4185 domain-containing protein [Nocardioidaceae bacterium]
PDPALGTMVALTLAVLVAGSATLALEALAGLAGLAIGATLFVVEATPLLLRTDVHLLPQPWAWVLPLTPVGAMDQVLTQMLGFEDSATIGTPLLVLGSWLVLSWLTSLMARYFRGRVGMNARESFGTRGRGARTKWRLQVGAVLVPVATVLLTLAVVVPRDAVAAPESLPSRASETECVETGPIHDIKALNRFTSELRSSEDFLGGDVGASVELQDSRTLFVFGDTLRSADYAGQRFVRNSMLVREEGCMQMVSPADRGAIIPDRSGGKPGSSVGYWPMSIGRKQYPGYDLVAVSAQRVRSSGTGAFDFENLGASIAVFMVPRGGTPQLVDQRDIGPDDPGRDRPAWGAASAVDKGWAYLYGTSTSGTDLVFGYALSVARVRPSDILDQSKWRFWNGSEWGRDAGRAV